ncbi:hypothetical protein C8F01DRAFT_1148388 [Mycena amicta]|nr:hypothetical protein C8F01DRAFT_1148388 [Mycena amicta]
MRQALRPSAGSGFTMSRFSAEPDSHVDYESAEDSTPNTSARGAELDFVGSEGRSTQESIRFQVEEIVSSTKPIYEGLPASSSGKSLFFFNDQSITESLRCSTPALAQATIGLGLLGLPFHGVNTGLGLLSQSPLHHLRVGGDHDLPTTSSSLLLPSSLSFGSLAQLEEGLLRTTTRTGSLSSSVAARFTRIVRTQGREMGFLSVREPSSRTRAIVVSSSVASLWNLGEPRRETILKRVLGAMGRVLSRRG